MSDRQVSIFYDAEEQHRILARDVEEYLAPIYRSEAKYTVPILSPEYPRRAWTKIESDNFKERFGTNAVIPIRLSTVTEGFFSDEQRYGYLTLDVGGDIEQQLHAIADLLCKRLIEDRMEARHHEQAA